MPTIILRFTLVLSVVVVPGANAQNVLTNGHFKDRSHVQTVQTHTCGAWSSATNWSTWIQPFSGTCDFTSHSGVELETDLLLGPLPQALNPPAHLIHVRTSGSTENAAAAGIVQVFGALNEGPDRVLASVWVYVVRGRVGMGVGNGGNAGDISVHSTKVGEWEQLVGFNNHAPANEFVLYATDPNGSGSPGPTEFYADNAIVCPADTDAQLARCRLFIRSTLFDRGF